MTVTFFGGRGCWVGCEVLDSIDFGVNYLPTPLIIGLYICKEL